MKTPNEAGRRQAQRGRGVPREKIEGQTGLKIVGVGPRGRLAEKRGSAQRDFGHVDDTALRDLYRGGRPVVSGGLFNTRTFLTVYVDVA